MNEEERNVLSAAVYYLVRGGAGLHESEAMFRSMMIRKSIAAANGNRSEAARNLKVHRNTLVRYLSEQRKK